MAGEIASSYVSLLPSAQGFGPALENETSGPVGKAGKMLGGILAAGLLGAAAIVGASLTEAISQEADTDRMAAALGLSPDESARLGGVAGRLYADAYAGSFSEATEAVEAVVSTISGMASASTPVIEGVTTSVLNLATAFGEDLTAVTTGVGTLLRTGLAPDAETALDIITAGLQSSANLGGDLLDVVAEYGSTFKDAGLTGEQSIGLINQALAAGIPNADFAADAIREMGIIIGEGAEESVAALGDLGLSAEDIQTAFGQGGAAAAGALDMILDGLRNTEDPLERNRLATELVGTQYEDLGDAILQLDPSQAVASLGDIDGAAANLGETLNDNAAKNLERFKNGLTQTFVDVIGGQVLPTVGALAGFMADNLGPALSAAGDVAGFVGTQMQNFAGWVAANEEPIRKVATVIAAVFLPYIIAMGVQATVSAIKTVAAWALSAAGSVAAAAILSISYAIAVAGWILMGAQALLGAAKVAAAWLIALGPIALVIAAVVGLVALIIWKFDDIKKIVAVAWEWIKTKTAALWNAIVGAVSGAVSRVFGVLRGIQSIINVVIGFFGRIKDGIVTKWNELLSFVGSLPGRLRDMGAGMWDWIGDTFRSALNSIIRLWNNFSLTIDIPDAIPGLPDEWTINTPNIPLLADGGFVTRPTLAVVGEAGPEAVVPLPRLGEFANRHAGGAGSSGTLDFDYDRLADALSRRPGYFSISDREAAKLQLMQNRAMADLP